MVRVKLGLLLSQSRGAQKQPLSFAVHQLTSLEFRDMYVRSLEQSFVDNSPPLRALLEPLVLSPLWRGKLFGATALTSRQSRRLSIRPRKSGLQVASEVEAAVKDGSCKVEQHL